MKIEAFRTVVIELSNSDCKGLKADINYLLSSLPDSERGAELPFLERILRELG